MVANDIVDLEYSRKHKNFSRPRLITKLFSDKEQQYILNSDDVFFNCCYLWSIKESAYKLYVQSSSERFFRPDLFQINLDHTSAEVTFKSFKCLVKTEITKDFIYSEAFWKKTNHLSSTFMLSSTDYAVQSRETRNKLIDNMSLQLGVESSSLSIKKSSNGIPSMYYYDLPLNSSISLTHHGRFGAYSYSLK
ncbi:MAG: 4-phosphopantetheinyl transferase family protein [Winogradskyella sp.]|nr:4-phosphopantetheinyl transferase family protein [Winogradskyella sp.]